MNKYKPHVPISVANHEITDFTLMCNKISWKFHN